MELKKYQNDIVNVEIGATILFLLVGVFYPKLWVFYTALGINIVLLASYKIITKYYFMIYGLSMANRFVGKVNNTLEGLNGQISREI